MREAKEGLEIFMEAINEGKLKALEEEDQREKKMDDMLETLGEMQRELSQIHPDSLEIGIKKLKIHHDSLETTKSEMMEQTEEWERARERTKLLEPSYENKQQNEQKHDFYMDEETLRRPTRQIRSSGARSSGARCCCILSRWSASSWRS